MFSFLKNKTIDETPEEQKADVEKYPLEVKSKILNGIPCDQIPNASGDFGITATNPIPVNGVHGEMKYLNRLRTKSGIGFFYHRLGSFVQKGFEEKLDAYEIVSYDGKKWDVLYFDMYHPCRSKITPPGYTFADFDPMFSKTIIGSGLHDLDTNFPNGIPEQIAKIYGSLGSKIGEKLKTDFLDKYKYVQPQEQVYKVLLTSGRIGSAVDQPLGHKKEESQKEVEVAFLPTYKPSKKEKDIKNIDTSKIKVEFGTPDNPEKDDKLIDLFRKAQNREIRVYTGDIYIDKIKPFCTYKPKQEILDSIKDQYLGYVREGDPQYLHVYPDGDSFIMSDDYAAYYTYLNVALKTVPCIIFGDTDSKYVLNKKEINWDLQHFTYK